MLVGSKEVEFKLNTGAEVTAISNNTYGSLEEEILVKPTKTLYGRTRAQSPRSPWAAHEDPVVQAEELKAASLRGERVEKQLTRSTGDNGTQPRSQGECDQPLRQHDSGGLSPKVSGLRQLWRAICKLRPEAKPHALYSPRSVPLPRRNKVKEELTRMDRWE